MKIWGGGEHCDVIVVGAAVSGQLHVVVVVVVVLGIGGANDIMLVRYL